MPIDTGLLQGAMTIGDLFDAKQQQYADLAGKQAQTGALNQQTQQSAQSFPTQLGSDQLKNFQLQNQVGMQLMSGVHDQASLDQAHATAASHGLDTSAYPKTYDPNSTPQFIQQKMYGAMDIDKRLFLMMQQADLAERQQHDRALESISGIKANVSVNNANRANADDMLPPMPGGSMTAGQLHNGTGPSIPLAAAQNLSIPPSATTPDQIYNNLTANGAANGPGMTLPGAKPANAPASVPTNGDLNTAFSNLIKNTANGQSNTASQPASAAISAAPVPPGQAALAAGNSADPAPAHTAGNTSTAAPQSLKAQEAQAAIQARTGGLAERQRHDQVEESFQGGGWAGVPAGAEQRKPGEDVQTYLARLPATVGSQAQQMANAEVPFPSQTAIDKNPALARTMEVVKQIDPDVTSGSSQSLQQFRSAKNGTPGAQVASFSKLGSHLDTLTQLGSDLQNGDVQGFNQIANAWAKATGQPAPTNFDAAKQIVGGEIVKAIVGAGGGEGDREKAQAVLNSANSPAQLAGAVSTIKDLVGGQLGALRQQYTVSTGRNDFDNLLSPAAKNIFSAPAQSQQPAASALPPCAKQIGTSGGKAVYQLPDGSHVMEQ